MTDERHLQTPSFHRRTAGPELLTQLEDWAVWTCEGPEFRHHYDQGVTLCVRQGRAVVDFADGSRADLRPGDAMTVTQGASAVWTILEPIRNRYNPE